MIKNRKTLVRNNQLPVTYKVKAARKGALMVLEHESDVYFYIIKIEK